MSSKRYNYNLVLLSSGSLISNSNSQTIGNIFITGGNVGIGTTSPLTNLHVNGPGFQLGTGNTSGFHLQTTNGSLNAYSGAWGVGISRFCCDSRGNFGIGTISPTTTLDIINTVGNSNLPFMRLGGAGGLGNQVGIILSPVTNRSGASSQITAIDDGNSSAHLTFGTAPTGVGTTLAERMRITNAGNVGIGTTNPSRTLHVTNNMRIGGSGAVLDLGDDFTTQIYRNGTTSEMRFNTNSIERITITSTGNIGIGTTSPIGLLHTVLGDATGAGSPSLWDSTYTVVGKASNTGGGVAIGFNSASGGSLSSLSPSVAWQTMRYRAVDHRFIVGGDPSTAPAFMVANSGSIGIGTTAPQTTFHVTPGRVQLGPANSNGFHFDVANGGALNAYSGNWGGGTTRFCCDSRGNFGIGTLSPSADLHVIDTTANNSNPASIFLDKNGERAVMQVWNYNNNKSNLRIGSNTFWNNSGDTVLNNTNPAIGWSIIMGAENDSFQISRQTGTNTGNEYINMVSSGSLQLNILSGVDQPNYIRIGRNDNFIRYHDLEFQTSVTSSSSYVAFKLHTGVTFTSQREVMRLRADGNVGIGTTSPSQKFVVSNGTGLGAYLNPTGSGDQFTVYANGSTPAGGYFYYNSGNGYGTISDRRIKENILPINTSDALDFITSITPVSFRMNNSTEQQAGFIAQDIYNASSNDIQKSALANWSTYDENNPDCPLMGVSDRPLISYLVASLKEVNGQLQTTKQELQILKQELQLLKQFISSKFT